MRITLLVDFFLTKYIYLTLRNTRIWPRDTCIWLQEIHVSDQETHVSDQEIHISDFKKYTYLTSRNWSSSSWSLDSVLLASMQGQGSNALMAYLCLSGTACQVSWHAVWILQPWHGDVHLHAAQEPPRADAWSDHWGAWRWAFVWQATLRELKIDGPAPWKDTEADRHQLGSAALRLVAEAILASLQDLFFYWWFNGIFYGGGRVVRDKVSL